MNEATLKKIAKAVQQGNVNAGHYVLGGRPVPSLHRNKRWPTSAAAHLDFYSPPLDQTDLSSLDSVKKQLTEAGYTVNEVKSANTVKFDYHLRVTGSSLTEPVALRFGSVNLECEPSIIDDLRVMSLDDHVPHEAEIIASGKSSVEEYICIAEAGSAKNIDVYLARSSRKIPLNELQTCLGAVADGTEYERHNNYSRHDAYASNVRPALRSIHDELSNGLVRRKEEAFELKLKYESMMDGLGSGGDGLDPRTGELPAEIQKIYDESVAADNELTRHAIQINKGITEGGCPFGVRRQNQPVPSDVRGQHWELWSRHIRTILPSPNIATATTAYAAQLQSLGAESNTFRSQDPGGQAAAPSAQTRQSSPSLK